MVELLLIAAKRVRVALGLPLEGFEMAAILYEAKQDWVRWARARGNAEDVSVLDQQLRNVEEQAKELIGRLGVQARAARAWYHLGKAIVDVFLDSRRADDAAATAATAPIPGESNFVFRWGDPQRLRRQLAQARVILEQVFLDHAEDHERLPILRLPEDFLGWHYVEAGLQQLTQRAASEEPCDPAVEDRNAWVYQLRKEGTPFKTIVSRLRAEHPEWGAELNSNQAVQGAIKSYARRHQLPDLVKKREPRQDERV